MSKPYTEADLSDQIVGDLTWRIKEISDLKAATLRADSRLRKVLLRAIVTISYAHWEGFVKYSARKYMDFVVLRKIKLKSLNPQFVRNLFLTRLANMAANAGSVSHRCDLIDEILMAPNTAFSKYDEKLINTKSNLTFAVFRDICLVCGVKGDDFDTNEDFIDKILLRRRNEIAHGEETFVDIADLEDVSNKTIELMRGFCNAIENNVYSGHYRLQ